jgi:hypothetical protein
MEMLSCFKLIKYVVSKKLIKYDARGESFFMDNEHYPTR